MAIMFAARTYDHAQANNYSLYNANNGQEYAKYANMSGIVDARPKPGYVFIDGSFKTKKNSTDVAITFGTLSADKRNFRFNIDSSSMGSDFTALTKASAPPVEPPKYYKITQEAIDALLAKGFNVFVDGAQAVANKDYLESAVVTIKLIDTVRSKITESDYPIDPTQTFITVNNWYAVDLSKIRIVVYKEPYTFEQSLIDSYLENHIVLKIGGEAVTSDKYYNTNTELVFEVQGGKIKRVESDGNDGIDRIPTPVVANDSRSASYPDNFKVKWLPKLYFEIQLDSDIIPDIPDEGSQTGDATRTTLDVYRMNPDDVHKFVSEFHGVRIDINPGQTETFDYGKFILSLIRLPFSIQENLILEKGTNIVLGKYTTKYKADKLKIDTLRYNIGQIYTPAKHGNLLDYANTTTVLHLPFVTPITLDAQYVIGYTIQIEFVINLNSGSCDINIRTSKLDEGNGFGIIASVNVDLNAELPWGRINAPTNDPHSIGIVTDNKVNRAYIEVIRNKPTLIDGKWTIPISDERKLLPAEGYVEVDHIDLASKASRSEKLMILSALSSGVIIK